MIDWLIYTGRIEPFNEITSTKIETLNKFHGVWKFGFSGMMLHLSFDYNSNGHTTTDSTRDHNIGLSSDSSESDL